MSKTRRRTDMWMSTNRVLTGGSPKTRPASLTSKKAHPHRNPNFEASETKLLISLWGDPKIQKALITTHRKHPVIARIAEQMHQRGYYRTPEEINTRIKNLKCFYNRIKKDLDAGVIPYPTWKHYPAMDKIMTTPVFSVRPDEMPKPSPRFKMEPDSTASDSRSDELSDDESFPAELLSTELTYDDDGEDENRDCRKDLTEKDLDIDVEEVIVPKEEPIEVDDDDEQIPEQANIGGKEHK